MEGVKPEKKKSYPYEDKTRQHNQGEMFPKMEAFDETENFHTAIKLILLRFIVKTTEFCAKIQF